MLIDAHAHIDRYEETLAAALHEIARHEIFTLSTAMDPVSYRRTLEIAERCELVLPTFGIHPWHAPAYADRLAECSWAIERAPILGEIGLDFHWVTDVSQYQAQRKVLEFFLAAAREQAKIVNLHTKGAEAEILRLLDRHQIQRAIVHWYSGPLPIFRSLVSQGYYFTIGVEVLCSTHIQTLTRELPLAQLLTETDNPGGLKWLTGQLGMPLVLRDVVHTIAELKSISVATLLQIVQRNFARLIQEDPWLSEVYTKRFSQAV